MKDLKPALAVDEMFPEGAGYMDMEESGGSSATGLMMDLPSNEKHVHVHADFYNDFDDLFDDDNWSKTKQSVGSGNNIEMAK